MSRPAGALGGDALDALFSSSAPESKRPEAPEAKVPRSGEPIREGANDTIPVPKKKRKVGRPRGANFGAKKTTRWMRSDGAEMRARSVHIPVDLDSRLRRRAAEEDKPVGQVIVELLDRYLR